MWRVTQSIVLGGALLVAACQAASRPEQNAQALAALHPAADCAPSLPWFGRLYYGPAPWDMTYMAPDGRIRMGNDGGWCMIGFNVQWAGIDVDAPLSVRTPPAHGEVMVGSLAGRDRIAYRPAPGFTGSDAFSVHMASPEPWDIPVRVEVTR